MAFGLGVGVGIGSGRTSTTTRETRTPLRICAGTSSSLSAVPEGARSQPRHTWGCMGRGGGGCMGLGAWGSGGSGGSGAGRRAEAEDGVAR